MDRKIKRDGIVTGIGAVLFVAVFFLNRALGFADQVLLICYLAAYIPTAFSAYRTVIKHIKEWKIFDEHFLIVLATIGAFLVGEYAEAEAVMLFFQLGKFLEAVSLEKSKRSIEKYMDIKPTYANRIVRGKEFQIDPKHLKIGHVIVIKPGERIPVDAVVTSGNSTIDTKALTGEAVPRAVKTGDKLYSGSINLTGALEARVAKEYQDSTVAKILDLVEKASERKGEHETFAERFTKWYTPIVTLLAFAVMLIPAFTFAKDDLYPWIYRGLIVLVAALPCGLMVSVPLAFFGGISSAARQGILIKGVGLLEDLTKVDTFVFDKTGTLTEGQFSVAEICPRRMGPEELLEKIAYAESYSNHPIAYSLREAYEKPLEKKRLKWVREFAGYGVKATLDGQEVLVGNQKFLNQNQIFCPKTGKSGTGVHLAVDGEYEGYILIRDELREDTSDTIRELRKRQMSLVMLTGDNEQVAKEIGRKLKIDYIYANLLPEDKVEQVEEFLESEMGEEKLACVGDGLNDAPVLARADIGIAMGGLGSDAAIEAADIVLMEDEPYQIITALNIARETVRAVKQNMFFAIGIKVILLILAAIGYVSMKNAIIADMAVMILTLLNSFWTIRYSES